ncbi:MAG TPA: polyprenol phosphomannose-dependent alpha 1,6 mannosyltransferase MptB [Streptosporangiaceae bacterium]|nr:polyprenol phosphomannose-dependent alpha 1,6 mannosyltransferase MptB [Streptosporangiaceae bacterium]
MSRVPGAGGRRQPAGAARERAGGTAATRDARPGAAPQAGLRHRAWTPQRAGRAGLAASGLSVALTLAIAVVGPSLVEPALPGRPGTPPWFFAAHPSPYLVVALTALAIAAGATGLGLTIGASRRGWQVSPLLLLGAGIVVAVVLALIPPFGSGDHLSYAAYGRMAATGHDPYTTTPAELARLGDPIARAVGQWRDSPSVYGALASGGQALASLIGGTSVRLTVFVISLQNVLAFCVTGLLLHGLARGDRRRQLRAAVLWTANPLLLQVLVAGAHVDSQAIVFVVAALAAFGWAVRSGSDRAGAGGTGADGSGGRASLARLAGGAAVAGALVGLGFAIKVTMALAGTGLALACLLAWRVARREPAAGSAGAAGAAGRGWREPVAALAGLAAGFAVTAGASLAAWGLHALSPAAQAGSQVSIGSPWRAVRSLVRLAGLSEAAAEDAVKFAAVALGVVLLILMLAAIMRTARRPGAIPAGARAAAAQGSASAGPDVAAQPGWSYRAVAGALAGSVVAAAALAWLFAWPYVLPWYDGLGWALLVLLPASRLDWLMLARTTALAFGYLTATGAPLPSGLGWLETVVRTGVTPVILLACVVTLIALTWPGRGWAWPGEAGWRRAVPFGES